MPVFRVFRKSESPEYYKQDRPRQLCWRGRCLLPGAYRNLLRNVCTIFETLEDAPGIFRSLFQRIKNLVSHFHRCLECCFLAAVLAVREIFGELVPPAADAESPSLERRGFVCISGNVALGHIVVAGLSTGCVYTATSGYMRQPNLLNVR